VILRIYERENQVRNHVIEIDLMPSGAMINSSRGLWTRVLGITEA